MYTITFFANFEQHIHRAGRDLPCEVVVNMPRDINGLREAWGDSGVWVSVSGVKVGSEESITVTRMGLG